jgi:diguanylate cyclase (GGDEF)-like protein
MLLDLDRFKEVNDTLGHHVGDLLLTQIGPRVREVLGDAGGLISRLGGDEFAVVVPQPRSTHDVLKQAEAVREALRQPFEIDGMALEIGASVGVALYPDHGRDSHELMRCADIAMYFAKSTSAGVTLYTPQLDHHTPERLAMMSEIGAAIRGKQMMLNYQPLLSLNGGVCALEALTRWQHPRLGVLAPERFIGLAEMSDLIHELALWVLDSAVAEARSWHDAGHPMRVAVNLSTRNLLDLTMARQIGELITRHELPARYLEIEITESALMADPERALDVVHAIARLGVRLSIDDFGTGYSSLAYLKRLPVSTLKIDRTFVGDMLRNEQDALIVRSTVQLAQSLGLEVVAEGVEDAPTLEALRAMGCDIAQGFHIARPMAGEAVPGWLASAAESDGASNLAMN